MRTEGRVCLPEGRACLPESWVNDHFRMGERNRQGPKKSCQVGCVNKKNRQNTRRDRVDFGPITLPLKGLKGNWLVLLAGRRRGAGNSCPGVRTIKKYNMLKPTHSMKLYIIFLIMMPVLKRLRPQGWSFLLQTNDLLLAGF